MKKIKNKLFLVTMILAAFSFMVACPLASDPNYNASGDSNGTTDSGDDTGDQGNNDDDSGAWTKSDSEKKLEKLAENGFEFAFKQETVSGEDTTDVNYLYGEKGDVAWVKMNNTEYLEFKQADGSAVVYVKEDGDEKYTKMIGGEFESLKAGYISSLYWGYTSSYEFRKSGTKNVAGKTCDLYVYRFDELIGWYFEYAKEPETGLTFYYKLDKKDGGVQSFEVTSFKLASEVTAKTEPPASEVVDYSDLLED